jgi:hypothetical protein
MLPDTTVGTAVSSLVPCPKESSLVPLGASAFRFSTTLAQSTLPASSTLRFASVSTSKLLPLRLTSGWLANAAVDDIRPAAKTTAKVAMPARPLLRRAETICFMFSSKGERQDIVL